jgi:uncharacterized protein (TIGR02145 family)
MNRAYILPILMVLLFTTCKDRPRTNPLDPNAELQDCNGEWGGTAFENACEYCVGGNTGLDETYCDPVTDIDGNEYETVIIGNQNWMAENLKVTHYRNGDVIPTGYSNSEWTNLSTGAYCIYDDAVDNPSYSDCPGPCADVYGNLYNRYAVDDSRNIAPEGWHVPNKDEWQELVDHLGGSRVAGSKLAGNADLWIDGDLEDNSEFGTSGFTALPGGLRGLFAGPGYYGGMGKYCYFWSSTNYTNLQAYFFGINLFGVWFGSKRDGFSVRCVKD